MSTCTVIMDLPIIESISSERLRHWGEKRLRERMQFIEEQSANCDMNDMMGWMGLFAEWSNCWEELKRKGLVE